MSIIIYLPPPYPAPHWDVIDAWLAVYGPPWPWPLPPAGGAR